MPIFAVAVAVSLWPCCYQATSRAYKCVGQHGRGEHMPQRASFNSGPVMTTVHSVKCAVLLGMYLFIYFSRPYSNVPLSQVHPSHACRNSCNVAAPTLLAPGTGAFRLRVISRRRQRLSLARLASDLGCGAPVAALHATRSRGCAIAHPATLSSRLCRRRRCLRRHHLVTIVRPSRHPRSHHRAISCADKPIKQGIFFFYSLVYAS
jgi:hypothetical protein